MYELNGRFGEVIFTRRTSGFGRRETDDADTCRMSGDAVRCKAVPSGARLIGETA